MDPRDQGGLPESARDAGSVVGNEQARQWFYELAKSSKGTDASYYSDMVGMLEGHPRRRICMQGYHAFVLEADGCVHACVNSETLEFGDLLEQPFHAIWWGQKAEALRRALHKDICPLCPSLCYVRPVSAVEVARLAAERLKPSGRTAADTA